MRRVRSCFKGCHGRAEISLDHVAVFIGFVEEVVGKGSRWEDYDQSAEGIRLVVSMPNGSTEMPDGDVMDCMSRMGVNCCGLYKCVLRGAIMKGTMRMRAIEAQTF
jgi:hypothetical protein